MRSGFRGSFSISSGYHDFCADSQVPRLFGYLHHDRGELGGSHPDTIVVGVTATTKWPLCEVATAQIQLNHLASHFANQLCLSRNPD